jgi:hypothetical protein
MAQSQRDLQRALDLVRQRQESHQEAAGKAFEIFFEAGFMVSMTAETLAKFSELLQLVPVRRVLVYVGAGDGELVEALVRAKRDIEGSQMSPELVSLFKRAQGLICVVDDEAYDAEEARVTTGTADFFRFEGEAESDSSSDNGAGVREIPNDNILAGSDGIITRLPFGVFVAMALMTGMKSGRVMDNPEQMRISAKKFMQNTLEVLIAEKRGTLVQVSAFV